MLEKQRKDRQKEITDSGKLTILGIVQAKLKTVKAQILESAARMQPEADENEDQPDWKISKNRRPAVKKAVVTGGANHAKKFSIEPNRLDVNDK